MTWADAKTRTADAIAARMGEPADYAGPGGAPGPARVRGVFISPEELADSEGNIYFVGTTVAIPVADLAAEGVDEPSALGSITQDPDGTPVVWEIAFPAIRSGEMWKLALVLLRRPAPGGTR